MLVVYTRVLDIMKNCRPEERKAVLRRKEDSSLHLIKLRVSCLHDSDAMLKIVVGVSEVKRRDR